MKIISKFKDYYDHVAGHDPDPRKVYNRVTREVDLKEYLNSRDIPDTYDDIYVAHKKNKKEDIRQLLSGKYVIKYLFFCDRIIPIIEERNTGRFIGDVAKYHYSLDTLPTSFEDDYDLNRFSTSSKKPFRELFTVQETQKVNRAVGSPIIYSGTADIRLAGIDFNRFMVPSATFTEIYNWLPFEEPDLPMGGPDDMIRWEQKGFDKKTSFRNIK